MVDVKPIIRYSHEELLKYAYINTPPKELLEFDKSIFKRARKNTDIDSIHQAQIKSILNKMTLENFDKLTTDLLKIKFTTQKQLESCVDLVFDKAVLEPDFCQMYAQLCGRMAKIKLQDSDNKKQFQQLLLNKCQQEFEKKDNDIIALKEKYPDPEELEMYLDKEKRKRIGFMKFIGELHNLNIITQKIIDGCLFLLLKTQEDIHLECMCVLTTTIMTKLDERVDPIYNEFVRTVKKSLERPMPNRLKFMIQALFEKGLETHRIV